MRNAENTQYRYVYGKINYKYQKIIRRLKFTENQYQALQLSKNVRTLVKLVVLIGY